MNNCFKTRQRAIQCLQLTIKPSVQIKITSQGKSVILLMLSSVSSHTKFQRNGKCAV